VVLLGATMALSSCSNQEAGAAAIVNDTTISDKDLQRVALQLGSIAKDQQQELTTSTVLLSLILAPYVLTEASRAGKGVTEAQARKVIPKVANPSQRTLEFVRMQLALQTLDDAARASILTKLGKAEVTVNPRYGTFDPKQVAIAPTAPNWIKAAGSTKGAK